MKNNIITRNKKLQNFIHETKLNREENFLGNFFNTENIRKDFIHKDESIQLYNIRELINRKFKVDYLSDASLSIFEELQNYIEIDEDLFLETMDNIKEDLFELLQEESIFNQIFTTDTNMLDLIE